MKITGSTTIYAALTPVGSMVNLTTEQRTILWHLHDLADFEECIRCVKRHLAPGGYFILDVFVPGLEILNRDPSRRYPFSATQKIKLDKRCK